MPMFFFSKMWSRNRFTLWIYTCIRSRRRLLLSLNATYLLLLLVEVVDDDADEQVEGEEGAEDDEDDKVEVHVQVDFIFRLLFQLDGTTQRKIKQLPASVTETSWVVKADPKIFLLGTKTLTSRESTAAYMMSIQPLNVAWEQMRVLSVWVMSGAQTTLLTLIWFKLNWLAVI